MEREMTDLLEQAQAFIDANIDGKGGCAELAAQFAEQVASQRVREREKEIATEVSKHVAHYSHGGECANEILKFVEDGKEQG